MLWRESFGKWTRGKKDIVEPTGRSEKEKIQKGKEKQGNRKKEKERKGEVLTNHPMLNRKPRKLGHAGGRGKEGGVKKNLGVWGKTTGKKNEKAKEKRQKGSFWKKKNPSRGARKQPFCEKGTSAPWKRN